MNYIKADIRDFHPTQITVGMAEVEKKQKKIEAMNTEELHTYRETHIIPVVIGPKKQYYILDHHHMVLALELAHHEHVYCKIVKDLSNLNDTLFWKKMTQARWIHPYDENGKKRPVTDIPQTIKELRDDPYRSLAAFVRDKQVYKKTFTPYAEFERADFFRKHIARDFVEKEFENTTYVAMGLADSQEAKYLSGWTGKLITL
jgi:hypothetical protein